MAFKVKDFTSNDNENSGGEDTSPELMLLRTIIGDDLANRMFGMGGQVSGMTPNGNITLNGESIDMSVVQSLVSTGIPFEDEDGNQTYRPMEVISVEVIE